MKRNSVVTLPVRAMRIVGRFCETPLGGGWRLPQTPYEWERRRVAARCGGRTETGHSSLTPLAVLSLVPELRSSFPSWTWERFALVFEAGLRRSLVPKACPPWRVELGNASLMFSKLGFATCSPLSLDSPPQRFSRASRPRFAKLLGSYAFLYSFRVPPSDF
jgi:hypothetical protein